MTGTKRGSNKMTGAQAAVAAIDVKNKLAAAISKGTADDVAKAESNLKTLARQMNDATLEAQHFSSLRAASVLASKKPVGMTPQEASNAMAYRDKVEMIFRKELMRRKPKKYDAAWYLSVTEQAGKNK